MRYVEARIEDNNREEAYRIYVARSLQLAPQSKCLKMSYADIISPQNVDERSGDEIVMDIMLKAGLKFED